MDIIVDGYNLIFAWGWLKNSRSPTALKKSRQRLIHELSARIPIESRHQVKIVFDAKTSSGKTTDPVTTMNEFRVIFAQAHDEADALIEQLIRQHANPKSLTIVSSDQRLKTAAARRKAISIDSDKWLDQLEWQHHPDRHPSPTTEPKLSAKERAIGELLETNWLAEFQLDEQTGSQPDLSPNPDLLPKPDSQPYNPFPPGYGDDLLPE